MSNKLLGLAIATAAALTFSAVPMSSAFAEGTSADKTTTTTTSETTTTTADVKCFGANACKGKGACKTAMNSCKGQNSCKGKGMMMMDSEKACTDAGGKTTE